MRECVITEKYMGNYEAVEIADGVVVHPKLRSSLQWVVKA